MRKLYALVAGLFFGLASIQSMANTPTADVASFTYTIDASGFNVSFTNTSVLGSEPGPRYAYWSFGDGSTQTTGALDGTQHHYANAGTFTVCLRLFRYITSSNTPTVTAESCVTIVIHRPDSCRADFERLPFASTNSPLAAYFKAIPSHNNNKKPARVCWNFGDGNDTCINYPENYTGTYVVGHRYEHPGNYEVCVKIIYYGGCEARKCKQVQVGPADECRADFEQIPVTTVNDHLRTYFKALPWNSNNRKPARICWTFGDGEDTCINYGQDFNGPYAVGHNYDHPGTYEVCVKILYYGGCEARKCKSIVVPPPPATCAVRLFEITPSISSLIRGFQAVPVSTPPRRLERICWVFGDGEDTCIMIDPQGPMPDLVIRHTYPGPGVYRACVKVRFQGGCEAYNCVEVVIRGGTNICGAYMLETLSGPRTYKFKGFSINNPNDQVISYRWTFGDGSGAIGQEVAHTYAQGGDYQVCLYIKTALGCESKVCKTVRVPGNNAPTLLLTPNPVINTLHVQFFSTHTETVYIKILNGNGTIVASFIKNVSVGVNNWDHDLANLLPGIYSYVLQSPHQLASAIFIKQ